MTLNKSTVAQIVAVSGKDEIWECLLSYLNECLM